MLLFSSGVKAGSYYSIANGNWTCPATWSQVGCGGAVSGTAPGAGDDVTICAGTTVAVQGGGCVAWNNSLTHCNNLAINNSGTLNFNVAATTLNVGAGLTMNGTSATSGTGATRIMNVAGAFIVSGGATATISGIQINVTGATTVTGSLNWSSSTGTKSLNNDVTISGTWTNTGNSPITIAGGLTNNGSFTSGTGDYTFTGAGKSFGGTSAITFDQDVFISGSYTNSTTSLTVTRDLSISGSLLNSSTLTDGRDLLGVGSITQSSGQTLSIGRNASITTLTATANPNTVNYNGSVNQIVKGATYHNLIIAITGSNVGNPGGAIVANGNLTISSGTLNTQGNNITVSGSTSISGTLNFSSSVSTISLQDVTLTGGTIIGGQVANVTVNTTLVVSSGSCSIGRCNLTVTGATSVAGGAVLDFSLASGTKTFNNDVTITGSWTNTGNTDITIGGNFTNNGSFTSGTTTIYTFSGAGKSFSGTTGSITFSQDVAISGSLTNSITVTVGRHLSGAGSLTQVNGSALNIGGDATITTLTASVNANTVTYNGSGAQILKGTTYYNLTINKSAGTATPGAAFTCNNNLTLTAGTLASGAFTDAVSGSTSITAGVLNTDNVAGVFNLQSLTMSSTASIAGTSTGNVNVATTLSIPSGTPTIGRSNLAVTGATTISGGATLDFNSVTGTKTFNGDVTITGTWTNTSSVDITMAGNFTNNGSFTSGNTTTYTFSGAGKSIGGSTATMTFTQDMTVSGTYTSTIGSLVVSRNLTVNGALTNSNTTTVTNNLAGAGTFTQLNGSLLFLANDATVTTLAASVNSNTVTYNGAGAQILRGATYYHLTINKASGTATANAAFTCNGNLTLTAGTLASGAFTHTVSGSTSITTGTLNTDNASGVFNLQSLSMSSTGSIAGSATGAVNVATTLSIPSGTPTIGRCNLTVIGTTTISGGATLDFNSLTGTKLFNSDVTINGTWTNSANSDFTLASNFINNGTFTSGATSNYTFSGAGKSLSGTTGSMTFAQDVTVTGSYTNSLTSLTVSRNLTVNGSFINPSTTTVTNNLAGSGSFTQQNGSSLYIWNDATITTLTASVNSNTVTYNGSTAQNVRGTTYYHLVINKSGGTATPDGAFTCNGNLTLTAGTLASSTFTHTVTGLTTITDGVMNTNSTSGIFNLQSLTMLSTGSIAGGATGTINAAGAFSVPSGSPTIGRCDLNVTGATTVSGGATLTFNSSTGTKTFNSDVTINGNWNSTSNPPFGLGGNIVNNGTFTSGTGLYTLTGAGKTISGTTGAITFAGWVTDNGSYTSAPSFTVTVASTLDGAGSFTQSANSVLYIGSDGNITTLNATVVPNTVYYYGPTTNANINCNAYYDLTISKTGGSIARFVCNTTVNHDLVVNSAAQLNSDVNTGLTNTVSGSTTIYGSYNIVTNTSVLNVQDLTMNGASILNGGTTGPINVATTFVTTGAASDIAACDLTVTGASTIGASLNFSSNSGAKIFNSLVTINAGATWTSTSITNTSNLIFRNGIANNGTAFSGDAVTFSNNNQSLSGSTALSFSGVVTVTGITLTNNAVFTMTRTNAGALTGTGTWAQGTGTLNYMGSTITVTTFNASAAGNTVNYNRSNGSQTIFTPSSASTYYNLTLNNSFGTSPQLTLAANTTVSNILTMTAGNVSAGASVLTLSSTTAANLSYTAGYINGTVRRYIASNASAYLFPVGSNTTSTDRHKFSYLNNSLAGLTYLDVSVADVVQGASNVDANLTATQGGTPITTTAGKAAAQTITWTTTPDAGFVYSSGSYGVDLYVENTTLTVADDNKICPIKRTLPSANYVNYLSYDGTTAIPAAGAAGRIYSAGNGYAERTGYTSFSGHAIGKGIYALPVEFLSFDAKPNGNVVDLSWSTASEFNSDHFVVQRSKDGVDFENVVQVNAAGNSSLVKNYSSIDYDPYNEVSYYRLKQLDNDGKFMFSNIVSVKFHSEDMLLLYPNPSVKGESFNVCLKAKPEDKVLIVIRDLQGKEFYSKVVIVSNDKEIVAVDPDGKIAAGVYMVVASSNDNIYEKKIMIR